MFLRQSTAQTIKVGPFLDETDGKTAETALTLTNTDFRLSKDGGNIVSSSTGSGTHDELGVYDKTLSTSDTDTVGELVVHVHEAGALPVQHRFYVVEEAVYDLLYASGSNGVVALTTDQLIALYAGWVWFDAISGASGTTVGTHGVPGNASGDEANALTLANSTGLKRIMIIDAGSYNAAGPISNVHFRGLTGLAEMSFGSQSIGGCTFESLRVSGVIAASGFANFFRDCRISSITINFNAHMDNCILDGGTVTLGASDTLYMRHCSSIGATSVVDFTGATSAIVNTDWSGDLKFTNMGSDDTALVEGTGRLVIDATCTGGTVTLRGDVEYQDDSGGLVTITVDTGVNLTQIGGSQNAASTWKRILDATIDTVITGGGGSTTSWEATGISVSTDDQLIDKVGVFIDGPAKYRGFVVTDFVGSSKTLIVDQLNVAPNAGDRFVIFA